MREEARNIARAIKTARAEEKVLSDIIPDVREWHKKFSIKDLQTVYSNVIRTLSGMPTDIERRIEELKFEIKWVEDKKKYPTWAVAKDAYKKNLNFLERKKLADGIADALAYVPSDAKEAARYIKSVTEVKTMLHAPRFDVTKAKRKAESLRKKYESLAGIHTPQKAVIADAKKVRRETLAEIKKRLGDDFPKILPNLEDAIEKYEKNNPLYGYRAKTYKTEIEDLMRELFDAHDLGMNIDDNAIEKVLDTWFKNTFEVGGGHGYVGSHKTSGLIETSHSRLRAAHKLFGLPNTNLRKDQLARGDYEKYGNLLDHDILDSLLHNTAKQYGKVEVRFKKNSVVATWTAGDSLCTEFQPSLVSDPRSCSFDNLSKTPTKRGIQTESLTQFKKDHIRSYLELQYHGRLTPDCVESIAYPYNLEDLAQAHNLEVAKKWKAKGIPVYFIGKDTKGNKILKML